MDLTTKEIAEKYGLPTYDPIQWHYIEKAMLEYGKQEAKSFASWIAHEVIAGRTLEKLWNDYQEQFKTA
jgi:hypothetical protein